MPRGKNTPLRVIDRRPPIPIGGVVPASDPEPAGRTAGSPEAPSNLALDDGIELIGAIYRNFIDVTWDRPVSFTPDYYKVAITDPDGTWQRDVDHDDDPDAQQGVHLANLKSGTLYTIKVRSVSASGAMSDWTAEESITTEVDSTPPAAVTSLAADFTGASLILTWTNPSDGDLRDCLVSIWADGTKAVQYLDSAPTAQKPGTAGRFEWSEADNKRAVGTNGDPSVYVEVKARDVAGNLSTAANVTATNSPPATPTSLVSNWTGDTGTADEDLILSWTGTTDRDLRGYYVRINSIEQGITQVPSFVYTFAKNRQDNTTADPSLTVQVSAIDAYGQLSASPLSGTPTNAAPAAPSITSFTIPFNEAITLLSYTKPADFDTFEYVYKIGTTTEATIYSPNDLVFYKVQQAATYTVTVRARDVFGQYSSAVVSSAAAADPLTISYLRANAIYSDSIGTAVATLNRLKDGKTDLQVTYTSTGVRTPWRWTQMERAITDRYRVSTIIGTYGSGAVFGYLATSNDGTTWRWFAGPIGVDGKTLTEVADEAAAQAAYVEYSPNGVFYFPEIVEARYVRWYHARATAGDYAFTELYGRRLVQSDDIEAEAVRAINIAASAVTADKISVGQLSAITADMGTLTAGTITGGTIRTATSGARIELNSTKIFGTDGSTTQWEALASTGKLTAGAGNTVLDANGITLLAPSSATNSASLKYSTDGTMANLRTIHSTMDNSGIGLTTHSQSTTSPNGYDATVRMQSLVTNSSDTATLILSAGAAGASTADFTITQAGSTSSATLEPGLNLGSATSATDGEMHTSGHVYIGTSSDTGAARLAVKGAGSTNATNCILGRNSAGTALFYVDNAGGGFLYATAWTHGPSSREAKRDIRPVKRGLADVLKFKPVNFRYKDGPDDREQIGFVAEELAEAAPELVETTPEGTMGIRTGDMIPMLTMAVQELSTKLAAAETLIKALEGRVEEAEGKLAKIAIGIR